MYPTKAGNWGLPYDGGFIGRAHSPMNLVQKDPNAKAQNLELQGISLDRLQDRAKLRGAIDNFRRSVDTTGQMDGLDVYSRQALGILSRSKLMDALDLSKEDPKVAERYGVNDPKLTYDGPPKMVR